MIKHWTLDAFRKEIHTFKRCSAHQESKSHVCWEVGDGMGVAAATVLSWGRASDLIVSSS